MGQLGAETIKISFFFLGRKAKGVFLERFCYWPSVTGCASFCRLSCLSSSGTNCLKSFKNIALNQPGFGDFSGGGVL